jgi:hypothetical protein
VRFSEFLDDWFRVLVHFTEKSFKMIFSGEFLGVKPEVKTTF